ncbi:MAG: Holliday junction resolvase RuvX [Deltaproteobacteria bacterium]|nr:Holliday junction resolvase RuvX [Deltaproteobacteria bacterium]
MRALGLDVGSKTIGVAVSDELGLCAHGLKTLRRQGMKRDVAAVLEIVQERAVETLVVGLPYDLEGKVGPRAERVLAFVAELRAAAAPPIETWDERFSTALAERVLLEADLSRRRRKAVIDRAAAAVILQGWLDHRSRGSGTSG